MFNTVLFLYLFCITYHVLCNPGCTQFIMPQPPLCTHFRSPNASSVLTSIMSTSAYQVSQVRSEYIHLRICSRIPGISSEYNFPCTKHHVSQLSSEYIRAAPYLKWVHPCPPAGILSEYNILQLSVHQVSQVSTLINYPCTRHLKWVYRTSVHQVSITSSPPRE